jgi:hypothetical protein
MGNLNKDTKGKKIVQIEFDNQTKHNVILKNKGQFLYYSMGIKYFLVDKSLDLN